MWLANDSLELQNAANRIHKFLKRCKYLANYQGRDPRNKPMCYPQQLGRFWHVFVPEPSTTSIAMCTGTFQNLIRYLPRNPPEPHQLSSPEPFGTSSAFCTRTLLNFISFLHQNPPEPCLLSTPEPSEPCLLYAPEPTGTRRNLISFLHGTLRNLINFLHRNPPPEPCLLSTPEPSGTSSAVCIGTVRNLVCYLHQNRPEPHQPSAPEPSGTFRNLLRNLGLQLHRIAPELFWAKDPIASFAVGEKTLQ